SERWHDNSPDVMIAKSARIVIVSVEQIVSAQTIMSRPINTILPRSDVTCVVEAPYGAHPCCCDARYDYDLDVLGAYHAASGDAGTMEAWLDQYVYGPTDHGAYLDTIGMERLMAVSTKRVNQ